MLPTKTFSSNWISLSLVTLVVLGLTLTVAGQFGVNMFKINPSIQIAQTTPASQSSPLKAQSLQTIEIAKTGPKIQTIKDQYTKDETIVANGLEIKILDFNKFIYTSTINQVQESYCAIGVEIFNQSDVDVKVLPDFDFELVDGSPSGGILMTAPLVKSIETKPALELVEFETIKLAPKSIFRKSIPFTCQENPQYQLIIKTTQFSNNPEFKVVNIKL